MILEQLKEMLPELSKNERKVAEYFLKYPYGAGRFSCEVIAASCQTSHSAVIRLCQKLGFSGYSEFKYSLSRESLTPNLLAESQVSDKKESVLQYYSDCIRQLSPLANSSQLITLADAILYANRVITLGYHHSGLSAQQLSFRLNRLNIDSHALSDGSIMESYSRILKQGDVAIIFSISGLELYHDIAKAYQQNRTRVFLITMTPSSELAKIADVVISLPYISHAASQYLLDDAITFFLLIEILIETINKRIQKSVESV